MSTSPTKNAFVQLIAAALFLASGWMTWLAADMGEVRGPAGGYAVPNGKVLYVVSGHNAIVPLWELSMPTWPAFGLAVIGALLALLRAIRLGRIPRWVIGLFYLLAAGPIAVLLAFAADEPLFQPAPGVAVALGLLVWLLILLLTAPALNAAGQSQAAADGASNASDAK